MGTIEYLNAIKQLERLADISSPDEIEQYDLILNQQPEFSFYSGKVIAEVNDQVDRRNVRSKSSNPFRKSSLAWMLALARVELGATVAMYGGIEDAFEFVAPRSFGKEEYCMLLADDAAAHLTALDGDRLFRKKTKQRSAANSDTVAYLRRLKVIRDMLTTARSVGEGQLAESSDRFVKEIDKYGKRLNRSIEMATVDITFSVGEVRTERHTRNNETYKDVTPTTPITRLCEANFMKRANRPGGTSR